MDHATCFQEFLPRSWKPPETEEAKAAKAAERAEKAKRKKEKKHAKEEPADVKSEEESDERKFLDMHEVCGYGVHYLNVSSWHLHLDWPCMHVSQG